MKNFFILIFSVILLTACIKEDIPTNTSAETITLSIPTANGPTVNNNSIHHFITPLAEKLSSIPSVSGQANTSFLRTVDGKMTSSEVSTSYTLTNIGRYSAPFEGEVHYAVTFDMAEPESQEGYYIPYNYSYKKSSQQPTWHKENLTEYVHELESVQHGFHPSPQKIVAILSELTDFGYISMYDEMQDLVEIGFELNTETHYNIIDELFLHPVEYNSNFFDASRCWYFTDTPSYVYLIMKPNVNELVSIHYFTEMHCDILDAKMEISSSLTYDLNEKIKQIVVPKEIIEEADGL